MTSFIPIFYEYDQQEDEYIIQGCGRFFLRSRNPRYVPDDEIDPDEPVEVFASVTFPVWMGNTTIHFINPLSELEALTFLVSYYNRPSSVAPFELIDHEVSTPGFDFVYFNYFESNNNHLIAHIVAH
jgi:hypothetical protein